jgi:hypothetical protein
MTGKIRKLLGNLEEVSEELEEACGDLETIDKLPKNPTSFPRIPQSSRSP